ncbi:MAG: inorganic phosphate transporter [Ignisphaera sp.]
MYHLIAVGLGVSAILAFSIGANDLANSIAPLVGSNVLTFRRAVVLFIAFMSFGALVQGFMVMKTLGRGVVSYIDVVGSISASLAAFIWIMFATYKGLPISTTHSIVGSVVGIGLAYTLIDRRSISLNLDVLTKILLSWVTSPISAMIIAIPLYYITKRLYHYGEKTVISLALAFGILAAYSFGANDVGNAVGVYVTITSEALGLPDSITMRYLAMFTALFISLGAVFFGRRVVETLAFKITRLDITTSIAANADAVAVWLYTTIPYMLFGYGMPISTSYAAAGAIIGAGIARYRDFKALNMKMLIFIMFAWVLTLPITSCIAISIYTILKYVIGL